MSLVELARNEHCRDTDKNTDHSYLPLYDELFLPHRHAVKNVLELGILFGGSIQLWRDYFSKATVTGVDVSLTAAAASKPDLERVRYVVRDGYTRETLEYLSDREYDLIVDDGPHTLQSMLFVAEHYSGLLSEGGILVIEDVPSMDWVPRILDAFPEPLRPRVRVHDRRSEKGRSDDILVILKK